MNNIIFSEGTKVTDLIVDSAMIENVYNCHSNTFNNKTLDSWSFVIESAKRRNDSTLFSYASFEYLKLERRETKSLFLKIWLWLMEITSGYGYRPSRTVISSFFIWLVFAALYWMISTEINGGLKLLSGEIISGYRGGGYALYFSLITFATVGFGDVMPVGPWAKLCAAVQSLSGLTFMALFIFSLTKRYGSFK